MFKLNEKDQIDRILKGDFFKNSPSEISTINTPNSQIYIKILGEDSVFSLLNSYLELIFDVLHAVTGNRHVDGDDIRIVNLAVLALCSIYKLTTGSGKHLEEINLAHIVSVLYNLLTSSKGSDDLSIGFDRSRDRRKPDLTKIKNIKGNYHLRIYF